MLFSTDSPQFKLSVAAALDANWTQKDLYMFCVLCVFFYYVSQITRNFCQWREWISSSRAVRVVDCEWLCVSKGVSVSECLNELWLAKCMLNRQLRFRGVMCVHTDLSLCPSEGEICMHSCTHALSLSHSLYPSLPLSVTYVCSRNLTSSTQLSSSTFATSQIKIWLFGTARETLPWLASVCVCAQWVWLTAD